MLNLKMGCPFLFWKTGQFVTKIHNWKSNRFQNGRLQTPIMHFVSRPANSCVRSNWSGLATPVHVKVFLDVIQKRKIMGMVFK
jgi:hypothetical protein